MSLPGVHCFKSLRATEEHTRLFRISSFLSGRLKQELPDLASDEHHVRLSVQPVDPASVVVSLTLSVLG